VETTETEDGKKVTGAASHVWPVVPDEPVVLRLDRSGIWCLLRPTLNAGLGPRL